MEYKEFLKTKEMNIHNKGYDIDISNINPILFEHQRFCVKRSIETGYHLIGASTGMGKTPIQLEIGDKLIKIKKKSALILAPLAIAKQTIKDGVEKFGYDVIRYNDKYKNDLKIHVSNYEQIDNIDLSKFDTILLDESSILKNPDGKLSKKLIKYFQNYTNNYTLSATPSPNKFNELGTQAEFLKVIKYNQFLAKFFTHDGGNTSEWIIREWAKKDFWKYISKWALIFSHPLDLGFNVPGYDLPKLYINQEIVKCPVKDGLIFNTGNVNATSYNAELRATQKLRLDRTIKIIKENGIDDNWFISINHNPDSKYLLNELNKLGISSFDVAGSGVTNEKGKFIRGEEIKADTLLDFANGKFQVLITKPKIAGFGMNFQKYCHKTIITGVDYSFEGAYQWIKRLHRFGQLKDVYVWQITTDTMQNTLNIYNKKNTKFETMQKEMSKAVCENVKTKDFLITDLYGDIKMEIPKWLK